MTSRQCLENAGRCCGDVFPHETTASQTLAQILSFTLSQSNLAAVFEQGKLSPNKNWNENLLMEPGSYANCQKTIKNTSLGNKAQLIGFFLCWDAVSSHSHLWAWKVQPPKMPSALHVHLRKAIPTAFPRESGWAVRMLSNQNWAVVTLWNAPW